MQKKVSVYFEQNNETIVVMSKPVWGFICSEQKFDGTHRNP